MIDWNEEAVAIGAVCFIMKKGLADVAEGAQRSGRSVRCTREFESHRCHDGAAWPSGLRR